MNTRTPGPVEADAAPSTDPGITLKELAAISFSLAYALDLVGDRGPWLSFRLRMARNRLDELLAAARSPARRDPETSPQVLGITTTGGPASPGQGEHVDPSPRPDFPGGEGGGRPRLSFDLGVGPQYDALPRGESWLGR